MSHVDISTVVLTKSELAALKQMQRGIAPDIETGARLNRLRLATWVYKGENGYWRISPDGERYLEYQKERRQDRRRESIRYWITTIIALLAFALSVIALLESTGSISISEWPIWSKLQ